MAFENKSSQITIAGAGIGGLTAALSLARVGISSTILEQNKTSSQDGAGIQIGPNGTRILKTLNVLEPLRPLCAAPKTIIAMDGRSGDTLSQLPLGDWISDRHDAPYWVVHRVDLHNVLFRAATDNPLITIEMDAKLINIDEQHGADELVIHTQNSKTWRSKALIGADGIWSRTRAHVIEDNARSFAPNPVRKSAARTTIPMQQVNSKISRENVTLWMTPDAHIVHYPIRNKKELAIIVVTNNSSATQSWGTSIEPNQILNAMADVQPAPRTLIEVGKNWRAWDLHTFPQLPKWHRGRTVLLGDAAHPMLPFLAQGGVMAVEDAYVLAECLSTELASHGDLSEANLNNAFQNYQSRRRSRVFKTQRQSISQGRIYHMSGVMAHARNLTMKHASPEKLMAGYDWLYGWRP